MCFLSEGVDPVLELETQVSILVLEYKAVTGRFHPGSVSPPPLPDRRDSELRALKQEAAPASRHKNTNFHSAQLGKLADRTCRHSPAVASWFLDEGSVLLNNNNNKKKEP